MDGTNVGKVSKGIIPLTPWSLAIENKLRPFIYWEIICLSTRRMSGQNDCKKKICFTGCHGYLCVVNLLLWC